MENHQANHAKIAKSIQDLTAELDAQMADHEVEDEHGECDDPLHQRVCPLRIHLPCLQHDSDARQNQCERAQQVSHKIEYAVLLLRKHDLESHHRRDAETKDHANGKQTAEDLPRLQLANLGAALTTHVDVFLSCMWDTLARDQTVSRHEGDSEV